MKLRLELLKRLLRDDGSIWINIDEGESHYLKVVCDEVFGRDNFVMRGKNGFPLKTCGNVY